MNPIDLRYLLLLLILVAGCNTSGPSSHTNKPGENPDTGPKKAMLPTIPDRISEKEAFNIYMDTLSSPLGLSIIMNDIDEHSIFTFCDDTLVIQQSTSSEWTLGTWHKSEDGIHIHFYKAAGQRGIGNPLTSPSTDNTPVVYSEYVEYVYDTDEEKILPWEDMKAIMRKGGNSIYVLADKKASCDLSLYNLQLPGHYPYLSSRLIDKDEIENLSSEELKIMINEIYARYGFIFPERKLRAYFTKQNWYKPRFKNVDKYLQGIEEKNLLILKEKEDKLLKAKTKKSAKAKATKTHNTNKKRKSPGK
jgi:hypothetical protein